MKRTKSFDAVGFMRSVRDRMSQEMIGMTSRQQIEYIEKQSGLKRRKSKSAGKSISAGQPKEQGSTSACQQISRIAEVLKC